MYLKENENKHFKLFFFIQIRMIKHLNRVIVARTGSGDFC